MPKPKRAPNFRVEIFPRAEQDLDDLASFIAVNSPRNAQRFVARLLKAISRLTVLPNAHAIAPESEVFERTIRELIVPPYRVLFVVEDGVVGVLRVRHGARDTLRPDDDEFEA